MLYAAFIIGILLFIIRLVARSKTETAMQDPYVRYWLDIVDHGKSYDVPTATLQVLPDEAPEVQDYLASHPTVHPYYTNGDPHFGREQKYRYKAEVNISGQPTILYSQPFINNEAGMQMNLQGRKTVELYITKAGEVHFIL